MKRKIQKRGLATPVLVAIVAVLVAISSAIVYTMADTENGGGTQVQTGTSVDKKAPNFNLTDLEGEKFSLKELQDKVVILDFMATWCPPCKAEMSHLRDIREKFDKSKLAIVSINVDTQETEDQLQTFKNKYEANWRFTKGSLIGSQYRVRGIPTIYIINKKGIITYKNSGIVSASVLESKIKEAS